MKKQPFDVDNLVNKTLKIWNIPGLSIAIVHQGQIVAANGYGVKSRKTAEPVNGDTLFQIASLTKAFTALCVSLLVQEGKLKWEEPIRSYLPNFKLKDPWATKEIILRDLLSHRSGLPGVSTEEARRFWYHTRRSTQDLIDRLAFVEPMYGFRSHFAYNDLHYVLAGEVIHKVTGQSFQQFCQEKILRPLEMKRTVVSYEALVHDKNVALPHIFPERLSSDLKLDNMDNIAATVGISSCARDMAIWLQHNLSSSKAISETQKPHVLLEVEGFINEVSLPLWSIFARDPEISGYGYGWMSYILDNRQISFHTGLSDGMQSMIGVIPSEKLGISIFVNQAFQLATASLFNELIDHYLGREHIDWHQRAHSAMSTVEKNKEKKIKQIFKDLSKKPPSLALKEYEGEYTNPAYGTMWIKYENNALQALLFTHEKGDLIHCGGNHFEIRVPIFAPTLPWIIDFIIADDKTVSLNMPGYGIFEKYH